MTIKVKDLVEFLLTKDQEMTVILNHDGWMVDEEETDPQRVIKERGLFNTWTSEGKSTLIIEN